MLFGVLGPQGALPEFPDPPPDLPIWPGCKRSGMCPVSQNLEAACALLQSSTALAKLYARGGGHPSQYYNAVAHLTQPTNLTHTRFVTADFSLAKPAAESLASDEHPRNVTVAVLGDSIARELSIVIRQVAPWITVTYIATSTTDLKTNKGVFTTETEYALASLYSCSLDAIFVGGFAGPWKLRALKRMSSHINPYTTHASELTPHLDRLDCLASHTTTPVVFVGSMPLDADSFFLSTGGYPLNFGQLNLANIWAYVEKQAERANRFHESMHFLHPVDLSSSCPGARCDGMHFGSSFKSFHCSPSLSIWFPFVADFLLSLGLTEANSLQARRRACRVRSQHMQANHPEQASAALMLDGCLARRKEVNRSTSLDFFQQEELANRTHVLDAEEWKRQQIRSGAAKNITVSEASMHHLAYPKQSWS